MVKKYSEFHYITLRDSSKKGKNKTKELKLRSHPVTIHIEICKI